jgi:hypothetical protein
MVDHKQHSTDNNHHETFRKFSSQSSDHSEVISCAQTNGDQTAKYKFCEKFTPRFTKAIHSTKVFVR